MYDVIIIGAGVSGTAIARELSRYELNICVLERDEDVCCGTSKANSGIVHAGYDAASGTLMARLNVRGNELMEQLAQDLDFPFRRIGSLVICRSPEDIPRLEELKARGIRNGVKDLRILNRAELTEMEPNISDNAVAALYAPAAGIVCPFGLNIALAENAAANGVKFCFDTEVTEISRTDGGWQVLTNQGNFRTRILVNAAGVFADRFHNMVSENKIRITPRKGEYCLLDHSAGSHVGHTIFTLPGKLGKGILVTPTIHGNLLIGPTASDIDDREGTDTTSAGMEQIIKSADLNVKNIPMNKVITSFAGLRAHEDGHEFIIGEPEDAGGFIDCAGIESPGLTACPAIGEMAAEIICDRLHPARKTDFIAERKGFLNPQTLTSEERNRLIRRDPTYGNIICRCEMISEGEIIDAIRRSPGARSLDGIKRRVRAGMGRCQSGFCMPGVMKILSRELGIPMAEITKSGGNSRIISGLNKHTDYPAGGDQL